LFFKAFVAISIIELFWSSATMVSVPLALLIRCKPRSLPGVRPLPKRTTVLKRPELSGVAIGAALLCSIAYSLPFDRQPVRNGFASGKEGRAPS
jgi:hypothetical protein